jgi:hypothetical protein
MGGKDGARVLNPLAEAELHRHDFIAIVHRLDPFASHAQQFDALSNVTLNLTIGASRFCIGNV